MSDQALETAVYTQLISTLQNTHFHEDDARLMAGECAAVIAIEWGDLKRASLDSGYEYKTLAERAEVVKFCQQFSAHAELEPGNSIAREYLAEFPVLHWKHLVIAKGLKDPAKAKVALERAVKDGMTVPQFGRFVRRMKKALGHAQGKIVIDNGRGLRVTIERYE